MTGFIKSFKRGLAGKPQPTSFNIAAAEVRCGLDWANRSATLPICRTWGHIEWFLADVD